MGFHYTTLHYTTLHYTTTMVTRTRFNAVAYPGILFGEGEGAVQQIQLRTEGRENGDLGAVAP